MYGTLTLDGNGKSEREIFGEATRWLLKLRDVPEDSPLRDEFRRWLGSDEAHRAAWENVSRSWDFLGAAQPAYDKPVPRSSLAPVPLRRSRRRVAAYAVGAIAASCLLWIAAPAILLALRSDYRTSAGESEVVRLEDGSSVQLSGGSAMAVSLDATQRRVQLLAGGAFFDVARDVRRPFFVEAGGAEVKVLGTAFDVQLSSSGASVALLHGSVEMGVIGKPQAATTLVPGQSAIADTASGRISVNDIEPEDIGAWREGKLMLSGTTVREAVEIVQRYHKAWIALPDNDLASRKVSGLFDLSDPDKALEAIVGPFGGKVRPVTGAARIVSRF